MKNVFKVIIAVVVAFVLVATIAVIIIMKSNSGEKADSNMPSTAVTESATQTTSETLDDDELEVFIDNADASRNDVSGVTNSAENKPSEEKSEEVSNTDTYDDKNTQKTESTVEEASKAEEETVDVNQAIEDALSGKGDPIELPILPVD